MGNPLKWGSSLLGKVVMADQTKLPNKFSFNLQIIVFFKLPKKFSFNLQIIDFFIYTFGFLQSLF